MCSKKNLTRKYNVFWICLSCGSHSSNVSNTFVEPDNAEDKENDDPEDAEGQTSRLWVDRFSPRHYTELLSDDVSFNSITGCRQIKCDIKISSTDATYFFLCTCSLQIAVCLNGWNSGTPLCLEEKGSPALFGLTDKLPTRTRPNRVRPIRT